MRRLSALAVVCATVALSATVFIAGAQAKFQSQKAAAATTVSLNGWVGAKVEDDLLREVIAAF